MEIFYGILAIALGVAFRMAIRAAVNGTFRTAKRVVTGETRTEKEIQEQALKEINEAFDNYNFDEPLSDEAYTLFTEYVQTSKFFGKLSKYPAICLYKGKLENLNFDYDAESLDIAKNISALVAVYDTYVPQDYRKFYFEMFLYYLVMYIKIEKNEFSGNVSKTEAANSMDIYSRLAGRLDNAVICSKIADMCTLEILGGLLEVYKTDDNGTELKKALIKHFAVAKPENVKMIFNELDADFQKGLTENIKTDKAAIKEAILQNKICGCDIPEELKPLIITEKNAVFSKDNAVVFEYYTKYYDHKTIYNDFYINSAFGDLPENIKGMKTENIRLYKQSDNECIINRRADIDFKNMDKDEHTFELAAPYRNIIVAIPKEIADKENMAIDDFISRLIISHKKVDSKNKSPQTLTIITDGEIAANTMAKIEDNFKKYSIVKGE